MKNWPPPEDSGQNVTESIVFGDVIQIQNTAGPVSVTTERPMYRAEQLVLDAIPISMETSRSQPSRLLLARHHIVPFSGRRSDLDQLRRWIDSDDLVSIHLMHAAGGQGKTRLALQFATDSSADQWAIWDINYDPPSNIASHVPVPVGNGILAVADYADRWQPSRLFAMVSHLRSIGAHLAVKVRILLLARSAGYWWDGLTDRVESEYGIGASASLLPPLGAQVDRWVLYREARDRFASALGFGGAAEIRVPDLTADSFASVLAVHMAALVGVDAHRRYERFSDDPLSLSAYLLRRERAHWHAVHSRVEDARSTSPEAMNRVVYTAVLAGPVDHAAARRLLGLDGLDSDRANRTIDDHRFCYPPSDPRTVLEPLRPDRLGEDLVALATPGEVSRSGDLAWSPDPWTISATENLICTADGTPTNWAPQAMTVLVEA